MAGAPKGNKNALHGIAPKTGRYLWSVTPDNLALLKEIAKREKLSLAQLIEKSILASYPEEFSGKF